VLLTQTNLRRPLAFANTNLNNLELLDEHIELLQLHKSGIRVASYLTELPPRDVLHKKLHQAVLNARASLETDRKRIE